MLETEQQEQLPKSLISHYTSTFITELILQYCFYIFSLYFSHWTLSPLIVETMS